MIWQTAKADDIGGRSEQQDRVDIFEARDGSERLLVVADGMGGHAGGEMAAEAVVETCREIWHRHLVTPQPPEELLAEAIERAHDSINAVGEEHGIEPRSTAVIFYADNKTASWAHVGDSRLYHFRGGEEASRTRDHSVVQMLVDMGKVSEDEMGDHPDQNRLIQSLGGEKAPAADFGGTKLAAGDAFLLGSDGLWEQIQPEEMAEALGAGSLNTAARKMVKLAARRGGSEGDNITVCMGRIDEGGEDQSSTRRRFGLFAAFIAVAAAAVFLVRYVGPETPPGSGRSAGVSADLPKPAAGAKATTKGRARGGRRTRAR